jgi:hypothetical protein
LRTGVRVMSVNRAEIIRKITLPHIKWAVKQINAQGWVPKRRNSTKYSLHYQGRDYPPKYLLMLAGKHATGKTLAPEDHSGGKHDSNKVLVRQLGFRKDDIVKRPSQWPER